MFLKEQNVMKTRENKGINFIHPVTNITHIHTTQIVKKLLYKIVNTF